MKHHAVLALVASITFYSPVYAETTTDGTIVVTASRTPQALSDTLAPVIVISGDELRRSATFDLAEALRFQAGLEIGRNGGPGQASSLFLRGTNSNHTQVLIDGVRVNPGTLGGAALHNIRPEDIERVEIVKGPRSSLYGTEAIGGVINIITRRPEGRFGADASAGFGSFATRSLSGAIRGRGDGWHAGLHASRLETDGFPPQRASTVARGHDNRTVGASVGGTIAGFEIEGRHWEAQGNTEYLDFFLIPLDQDFKNRVTAIDLAYTWTSNVRSRVQWSQAVDDIRQNQSPDYASTRRDTVDLQLDVALTNGHQINTGAVVTREHTEAQVFGMAFDERPDTKALYAQYQADDGDRRWVVAARHSSHDAFSSRLTWNAEFGQRLSDTWRITAGAGSAFRAPDSTQRFGFGGNPALQPERSLNIEFGIRGRLSASSSLQWQVYQNRIEDLVTYDMATFSLANIDRARIRGTELTHLLDLGQWTWRQSVVLQDTLDVLTGEPLPRRARRSATSALAFTPNPEVTLGADILLTSRRKDSGFSTDYIGGYMLLNLHAQWRPNPNWSVDLRIENALDRDYETALGFPQAGQSAFLRVRYMAH